MVSNTVSLVSIAWRLLLLVGTVSAQEPSARAILALSESEQVKFVRDSMDKGFPSDKADQMTLLLLNRSEIVLPLLEAKILTELQSQSPSMDLIETAAEMIAYSGDERALRVLGRLVAVDENRFGNQIRRTLDNALDRRNPFSVAYAGLRIGGDAISKRIVAWCERASSSDRMRRLWGEAMSEQYVQIPGEVEWRDDPLASRMAASTSEGIKAAVLRHAAERWSKR
jgi:hypothetical protein